MTTLLHIDSSARSGLSGIDSYGSHTRRLSARFIEQWRYHQPDAHIIYRDVGQQPPTPVSSAWIHAAFTPVNQREPWMRETLSESDNLIDELLAADIIVAAVPMYNFGPPAQFKAYIDNIVRVGRTFGFDRSREGEPYWPLLADAGKHLVLLSSRGDYGYGIGGRISERNHVEPSIITPFKYVGITQTHNIAVEYDEFGDERLAQSIEAAEAAIDQLVAEFITA